MASARKSSSKKKKNAPFDLKLLFIGAGSFLGIVFIILIIFLLLPPPFYKEGFENFIELNAYTNSTVELVPLESDNAVKPDFSKYYTRFTPGILKSISTGFSRVGVALGLKNRPPFSPGFFKTIVEDTLKKRTEKGYKKKCIDKIKVGPNAEFIIWGDIQGALHSLTLDLNRLKELGYLDENFKLVKPNTYIIFLGNIVNRTPYTLETLSLVLRILERNPDRVLYTKGSHETDGYWLEHTLKTEMKLRLAHLSDEKVPMKKEVMDLFDTVTYVSYIQAPDNNGNCFIRISRLERKEFPDQNFAPFLLGQSLQPLPVFSWQTKGVPPLDSSQPEVNIKGVLKIEKKRETYQPTEGLRMMEPDMGATAWTLISCPTPAYEKALKFYNDTFALLTAAPQIDQWTIEIHYQDRRNRTGFQTKKFNFMSGREITGAVPAPVTPAATGSQPASTQPQAAQPKSQLPVPAPTTQAAPAAQQKPQVAQLAQVQTVAPAKPTPAAQPIQTQVQQPVSQQTVQPQVIQPNQQQVAPASATQAAPAAQQKPQVAQPAQVQTVAPAKPTPAAQPIQTQAQQPGPQQVVQPQVVQPNQQQVAPASATQAAPATQQASTQPQAAQPAQAQAQRPVPQQVVQPQAAQPVSAPATQEVSTVAVAQPQKTQEEEPDTTGLQPAPPGT